ncbi:MAG: YegP family protein [Pyrinomonadaceae bacterium]
MAAKFVIKQGSNGQFHFNLLAGNGQIVLSSEMYKTKSAVENGIESVKKNSGDDARYERKTAKDDSPYFVLKATNGQEIGRSQMYKSASAMENGIESVKTNAASAEITDESSK